MRSDEIEKYLFYALLFLFPCNLAKHLVLPSSFVGGVLVDYLIPTVYVTDVLVLTLLLVWLARLIGKKYGVRPLENNGSLQDPAFGLKIRSPLTPRWRGRQGKRSDLWPKARPYLTVFAILLVTAGVSVFGAGNQTVAVYRWVKLLELALFALYVKYNLSWKEEGGRIVAALAAGMVLESFLVVAQWFEQGSVFGYWFFGEPVFNAMVPGIAKASLKGGLFVRPYGTFPHPNVLGGYTAVVLTMLVGGIGRGKKVRVIRVVGGILLGTTLLLSFSRTAWLAGLVGGVLLLLRSCRGVIGEMRVDLGEHKGSDPFEDGGSPPETRPDRQDGVRPLGGAVPLVQSLSWIRRIELGETAWQMWLDRPWLGVGLNNFTTRLMDYGRLSGLVWFLQPVHNVPLLVLAETGVVGMVGWLGLWGYLGMRVVRGRVGLSEKNKGSDPLKDDGSQRDPALDGQHGVRPYVFPLSVALLQILLISQLDHYFWTLQQTSLLFWLLVGLV